MKKEQEKVENSQAEAVEEQKGKKKGSKKEEKKQKEKKKEVNEQLEEEVDEQKNEVEELQAEVAEAKDKYLRLYSEFENFRRRTSKERIELIGTASREVIEELLPVVDDFERAMKAKKEQNAEDNGVELIYNKLKKVLEGKGLKKMEINPGDEFNDDYHEAITQIPAPEEKLAGKIVDVVEPGYFLNEKVVRFAKVVMGAKT